MQSVLQRSISGFYRIRPYAPLGRVRRTATIPPATITKRFSYTEVALKDLEINVRTTINGNITKLMPAKVISPHKGFVMLDLCRFHRHAIDVIHDHVRAHHNTARTVPRV